MLLTSNVAKCCLLYLWLVNYTFRAQSNCTAPAANARLLSGIGRCNNAVVTVSTPMQVTAHGYTGYQRHAAHYKEQALLIALADPRSSYSFAAFDTHAEKI